MNVLITGGAGFIGSHLSGAMMEAGHGVTVVDDLSTGSLENIR
ncbi:MAG: NAD-dependent epimerase/dehydratase family protein, partial [Phycisphaerae bacterium]|nr:NAD-dependent epimerase/dehydratase family protein [Phycisphaerae bacterium]